MPVDFRAVLGDPIYRLIWDMFGEQEQIMRLMRMKRGFTLIELLVVIAIIAILAAILFPVFAQAREKARNSACLNNTKQMGTAVQIYMDTWDEAYPASLYNPAPYGHGAWMHQLKPYLKTWDVYRCPSAPKERPVWLDERYFPWANYSYNEYIMYGPIRTDDDFSVASAIPLPVDTALIADGYNAALFHDWDDGASETDSGNNFAPDKVKLPSGMNRIKWANGNVGGRLQSRHNGTNIVFCDTHAKYVPLSKFYCKGGASPPGNARERVEFPVVHPWAKAP